MLFDVPQRIFIVHDELELFVPKIDHILAVINFTSSNDDLTSISSETNIKPSVFRSTKKGKHKREMSQRKFTNAKIVIFGGPGVGKTAFAVRYITKRFICDYDSDKEMMYTYKLSAAKDDITIEILDTTSKPSDDIMEKHIKWGEGFILIYSVIDRSSLEETMKAQERIAKVKGTEVPAVLVANKCDLLPSRDVMNDDAQNTAGTLDCPKFQISVAESSGGVLEVMEELLCQLKREFVKNVSASTPMLEKPKSKLYSMKRAFKKRINRSHSDTF